MSSSNSTYSKSSYSVRNVNGQYTAKVTAPSLASQVLSPRNSQPYNTVQELLQSRHTEYHSSCCEDDSVCNANYVHNLNEKFKEFYLKKITKIESESAQYKASNKNYSTQLDSYKVKTEHYRTQLESYQLKVDQMRKYQSLYNDTKLKNDVLEREIDALKERYRNQREKEATDNSRFKLTVESYISQVRTYKTENAGLEKFQQLYNETKSKNDFLGQQIAAWEEKEKRLKLRNEETCRKRAKDRARLKEQLRTYETLLDTGMGAREETFSEKQAVFEKIDANGDGIVSLEELKEALN